MPLYDYQCRVCGQKKEIKLNIDDRGVVVLCTNNHTMTRRFSAPAVVFKGSGFYSTSSRKVTS